jgi:hypothetical protein
LILATLLASVVFAVVDIEKSGGGAAKGRRERRRRRILCAENPAASVDFSRGGAEYPPTRLPGFKQMRAFQRNRIALTAQRLPLRLKAFA